MNTDVTPPAPAPAPPNSSLSLNRQLQLKEAQDSMQFELDAFMRQHPCGFEEIIDFYFDETGNCDTLNCKKQLVLCSHHGMCEMTTTRSST